MCLVSSTTLTGSGSGMPFEARGLLLCMYGLCGCIFGGAQNRSVVVNPSQISAMIPGTGLVVSPSSPAHLRSCAREQPLA